MAFLNVLFLTLSLLLSGCGTKKQPQYQQQPQSSEEVGYSSSDYATEETSASQSLGANVDASAAKSIASENKVYFAFDSDAINDEGRNTIKAFVRSIANKSSASVTLEGHCDSRGTKDYNYALGQKRAQSVKEFMITQGLKASQIVVISYSFLRPEVEGENESAWKKNRRVVLSNG